MNFTFTFGIVLYLHLQCRTLVSNLQRTATFVSCVYTVKITQSFKCVGIHLLSFFHVHSVNWPSIMVVALCHKNVGDLWCSVFVKDFVLR